MNIALSIHRRHPFLQMVVTTIATPTPIMDKATVIVIATAIVPRLRKLSMEIHLIHLRLRLQQVGKQYRHSIL